MHEPYAGIEEDRLLKQQTIVRAAMGRERAELVLKNASYVNVFSNTISSCDIAISAGTIVGLGSYQGEREVDLSGKLVLPGFLDAHIHLESSLVSPGEFVKAVLPHGTTTVVTDPHEIANVMGTDGIQYMMEATEGLPVDVQFMLPSCVPATPMDESGAILSWQDIEPFYASPRVRGLAEMMNFVGVVNEDPEVGKSFSLPRVPESASTATRRTLVSGSSTPTPRRASAPTTSATTLLTPKRSWIGASSS